jgi:SNF2 family DNA or RNA helicase
MQETIARFKTDVNKPVLIISYERVVTNIDALKKVGCDLLVCDEAHRLKNVSGSKTLAALSQINCGGRRVLLTGTPIQNKYAA